MKRILHMPVTNSNSGVTNYILMNWKHTDKNNFRYDFATRSKSLDFAGEVSAQGSKIHYLSCSSLENEAQFIKEMGNILDIGYDAVHLHTSYWNGFLVEKLAMARKCPIVIVHSHSTMIDIADNKKRMQALELHEKLKWEFSEEMATNFCACSKAAADWLFGSQISRKKIKIFNNAVDTDKFKFNENARRKLRKELGLENSLVLGHVGRFVYQKNHELLIDIFKLICENVINAKLLLVGDGELFEQTKKFFSLYGLSENVLFLGRRSDVAELMSAMDAFLLPSRFEGLGLVLIEAQASGLKCFASKNVPEEANVTGNISFLPDDANAWCEEIIKFKSSDVERTDGSKIVSDAGYSLQKQIRIIEKMYGGEDRITY